MSITTTEKKIEEILMKPDFIEKITETIVSKLSEKIIIKLKEMETKLEILEKENKELKEEIDSLNQYERRDSIRIFGVKEKKNENTFDEVKNMLQEKLNIEITKKDINACHRVGLAKRGKNRAIIVKFISRLDKDEIYRQKRKLRGTKIVIKEDLTYARLNLYNEIKKKFGFKSVWTLNGKIFLVHDNKKYSFQNESQYNAFLNTL